LFRIDQSVQKVRHLTESFEEAIILKVMRQKHMNMASLARFLNLDPKTLRSKINIKTSREKDAQSGSAFPEKGGASSLLQI